MGVDKVRDVSDTTTTYDANAITNSNNYHIINMELCSLMAGKTIFSESVFIFLLTSDDLRRHYRNDLFLRTTG